MTTKGLIFVLPELILWSCATSSEHIARQALDDRSRERFRVDANTDKNETTYDIPDGTLESYIAYALRHSTELEALFEQWRAGVHRIAEHRRLPDPVISYAFYVQSVETRVGPQRHRLSLQQSFPWPARLTAGADAASARAQALQRRFDAEALATSAAVEEKYWTLWSLEQERAIHEEHLAILKGLSESASALLMTGQIALADTQQIDLAAARTEDLLFALDERALQAGAALKGIIGASQSLSVTVTSSPVLREVPTDGDRLVASVRDHPEVRAFEALAQAGEADARFETADRFPSFSLGVDWIETGETSMPDVAKSGKDAVIVGIGMSLPIWQRSLKESVEAYRAETRARRAEARAAEDRAVARLYEVLSRLRNDRRRIDLYQSTLVPQAQSVFESVLGSYVSGKGGIASILLAQKELLDLRVQLVDIQASYERAWALLESVVGREVAPKSEISNPTGDAK